MSKLNHDTYREEILTIRRFAWAVTAAEELVAVSGTLGFHYDDGRTFLAWTIGESVDPAVWIGLFLIIVTAINMFPVKVSIQQHPLIVTATDKSTVFWRIRVCFRLHKDHLYHNGHCFDAYS